MKTKRILALILCALMLVPALVSCGSGDDAGTPSGDTAAADTTAAETTVAETSEYEAPEVNYDGAEVTLAVIDYV
nr:LacI family transcriptional regulator [Clostridia bacterium]